MCQNYKHDLRTQVFSTFRPVSATDQEVGSNHCRDEKRTESEAVHRQQISRDVATIAAMKRDAIFGSNHCRDEKRTESTPLVDNIFIRVTIYALLLS